MEQEGKGHARPMSNQKRQPPSLATQDWTIRRPRMREMRKIRGDRQACSFGMYAWGTDRSEVGDMGNGQ